MKTYVKLYFQFTKYLLPYYSTIFLLFFISCLFNLAVLIAPLFIKVIFDYAYPYQDLSLLILFSGLSFMMILSFQIISNLSSYLELYLDQQLHQSLYKTFYSKLLQLPISFFKKNQIGDLLFKFTKDIEIIGQTVQHSVATLLMNLGKIIVLGWIIFSINPKICILAFLGVPLYFVQTHIFSKKLKKLQLENQELGSELYNILEERLSNMKLVKIFNKSLKEIQTFLSQVTSLFILERKVSMTKSLSTFMLSLMNQFWLFIIALYSGYCVIHHTLSIGEVIAITSYVGLLVNPFENLFQLYTSLATAQVSFNRIEEILDEPEEARKTKNQKNIIVQGHILFDHIHFSYNPEQPILKDLSFQIQVNQITAIVGRSGIGKTSILDLLLRFYKPSSGKILIDGTNLQEINLSSLRNQICLISQELNLFTGTIQENILYGTDESISEEQLETASKQADAHDFIKQLPNGYQTDIGPKGQTLSAGQKQRIAIARALIINPKIIIFDEATSNLDSESEKYIQNIIQELKKDKTIIIIAHRLSSVKDADRILILGEEGMITEEGTFNELLQKKQIFYRMYTHQTEGYHVFLEQLRLLIKSAQRYKRPFSCAWIKLPNLEHPIIEELELVIKLHLREIDLGGYYHEDGILIAFPETNANQAQSACNRLQIEIQNTHFEHLPKNTLPLHFQIIEFQSDDTLETLLSKFSH